MSSNLIEINQYAWELATLAMWKAGKELKAYSTDQIRRIVAAGNSGNINDIKNIIDQYSPAPPQGKKEYQAQGEIRAKRQKNKDFGKNLIQVISERDVEDIQRLLQYVLWNIKILEYAYKKSEDKFIDEIALELDCEYVNKEKITGNLKQFIDDNRRKGNSRDKRRR